MSNNIKLDPSQFWTLWNMLPSKIMDKYCIDDEYNFSGFANSIKMSDDEEIIRMMTNMIKQLLMYKLKKESDENILVCIYKILDLFLYEE